VRAFLLFSLQIACPAAKLIAIDRVPALDPPYSSA